MNLGYLIKKIRESKRFSQQEVADSLGISQKKYSNFESCKTKLSIDQLLALSKLLSFNLYDIIKDLDTVTPNGLSSVNNSERSTKITSKDALIEKYEIIIKDKEEIISLLKEKIKNFTS
ncbi:helix-turn-helix domain-containing protein [Hanstruepera flava]|uniref:helix-turn-helix domain-containing protein n=1 Tax=Hanstruepera flava TaxID=2930218 RepID=UPI0020297B79|nr:helix-turn-helix transcriptional regulator [Hanstruepera flava]